MFLPPANTQQFSPVIKGDRLKPSFAVSAQKQADSFTAIEFKQPADLVPCAKLKHALNDQVRIAGHIEPRNVIFLKKRFQRSGYLA